MANITGLSSGPQFQRVQNTIQDRLDKQAMIDLENERANARLGIAQAAEGRATTTFQNQQDKLARKLSQRDAINAAMASPDILEAKEAEYANKAYAGLMGTHGVSGQDAGATFIPNSAKDIAYQTQLEKLNAAAVGSYEDRLQNPLMTSAQRAEAFKRGMVGGGVDAMTAMDMSDKYKAHIAPLVSDNKDALKLRTELFKQSSQANRAANKPTSNTKKKGGGGAYNDYTGQTTALKWIDDNASKYTVFSKIRGEESGDSLKSNIADLLDAGYPPEAVIHGMTKTKTGDEEWYDSRTINIDELKEWLAKEDSEGAFKKFKSWDKTKSGETLLAQQAALNKQYATDAQGLLAGTSEKDARVGKSASQLMFGMADKDVGTITGASDNLDKASSGKPRKSYSSTTPLGNAMRSSIQGEVLNLAETDNVAFMKDYNSLGKTDRNKVDAVLNKSDTSVEALKDAPVVASSPKVTEVSRPKHTTRTASDAFFRSIGVKPDDGRTAIKETPANVEKSINSALDSLFGRNSKESGEGSKFFDTITYGNPTSEQLAARASKANVSTATIDSMSPTQKYQLYKELSKSTPTYRGIPQKNKEEINAALVQMLSVTQSRLDNY